MADPLMCNLYFYPRSPCGERRVWAFPVGSGCLFLSTLSLRRATAGVPTHCETVQDFYPRSPCGERPVVYDIVFMPGKFLSTLSLRRATESIGTLRTVSVNFYPRSPCGERQRHIPRSVDRNDISIHALLAESDKSVSPTPTQAKKFLSTLSLRRATRRRYW